MGNYLSHGSLSSATIGKVVLSNGTVQEFNGALTAAELMLEHPQQVVVEFNSAVANKSRPDPLPADKILDMGKVYLMLPVKCGKPAPSSSEEARRVILSASTLLRSRPLLFSSKFVSLLARNICSSGDVEVGRRFPPRKGDECGGGRDEKVVGALGGLPGCLDGRPEYMCRQISGRGWKPSLDTIKEKKAKVKVSHWWIQR